MFFKKASIILKKFISSFPAIGLKIQADFLLQ